CGGASPGAAPGGSAPDPDADGLGTPPSSAKSELCDESDCPNEPMRPSGFICPLPSALLPAVIAVFKSALRSSSPNFASGSCGFPPRHEQTMFGVSSPSQHRPVSASSSSW